MRRWLGHVCMGLLACVITFDYPTPPPGHLTKFVFYVSATSGHYALRTDDQPGSPAAEVMATPDVPASVPCDALPIWTPGPWYVVATARGSDGKESIISNELKVTWGPDGLHVETGGGPPTSPPVIFAPPPVIVPTLPTPVVLAPGQIPPQAWGSSGGTGWITDTCAWQGTCPR